MWNGLPDQVPGGGICGTSSVNVFKRVVDKYLRGSMGLN